MAKTKAKPKKKTKKAKGDKLALDVQTAAQNATDPDFARSLIKAFEGWETVTDFATKERKRTRELVDGRRAALKEAMEVGHSSEGQQLLKLSLVEQRWQEYEDSIEERREIGSACRDQVKNARQKIRDLMSPQLGLFNGPPNTDPSTYESTSTVDNPPEPEEDEPEPEPDETASEPGDTFDDEDDD